MQSRTVRSPLGNTLLVFSLFAFLTSATAAADIGTAFTYQGRLVESGSPVNDTCNFTFGLWDAATLGNQKGNSPQGPFGVAVDNGLFAVTIDFGAGAIDGTARWLEIMVQCPGVPMPTMLTPRQELKPAPHALALPGFYTIQNSYSPNLIGGRRENAVSTGVTGATISGGGAPFANVNRVTDDFGTVGGGSSNRAGDDTGSTGDAKFATVNGGFRNTAGGDYTTVGGGQDNIASHDWSTVGGGFRNLAGYDNCTVAGGTSNEAMWDGSTVGGGAINLAGQPYSTISGGFFNIVNGFQSTVGGGSYNRVFGNYATICGGGPADPGDGLGSNNRVYDDYGTVGGGGGNRAGSNDGSSTNTSYATVGGGESNMASGLYSTIGGGKANVAGGSYSTIGGGEENTASGAWSSVAGGHLNVAQADYCFVAGHRARANSPSPGSFVWADSNDFDFIAGGPNEFNARATGGVRFVTSIDGVGNAQTGVVLSGGSGSWSSMSDRNTKKGFASIDPKSILKKLAAMPITSWKYKAEADSVTHIGPIAQDFRNAFGLGHDERYITSTDADGVALAAIQGLHQIVQEKDCEIEELKLQNVELDRRNSELEHRNAAIEARLTALEAKVGP